MVIREPEGVAFALYEERSVAFALYRFGEYSMYKSIQIMLIIILS